MPIPYTRRTEKYKEEDKKKAEDANFINQSEMMALMIEKSLNDENLKDKLTDEDREAVKPVLDKVKEAVSKRDVEEVKTTMDELNKVWEPIVKKIYPQQDQNIDPSQFCTGHEKSYTRKSNPTPNPTPENTSKHLMFGVWV